MKHQLGRLLSHSTLILKGNGAMCVRSRWPVNFQQKIEGGLLVDSLEFGKSSIETVIWLHGGSISLEKVSEVIWYCILQEMGTESSWKNWSGLNVFQHHLIGFWSINSFFQQKQLFHSKSYMLLPQIPYEPIYIQRVNSTNRVSLLDFCFRFGRNSLTFPGLGRLTVGTKALSCRIFLGHLKHVRGMEDGGCTGLKGWLYYHPPVKAKNPIFFSQFFSSTIVDFYCLVRFTGGYSRQSAISFARDLAI